MRNLFGIVVVLFLVCLLCSPVAAGKKAGEIKDGVYTDATYNYTFKVPEGWGAKISSAKKPNRIVLSQKSYPIPRHFQGMGKEDYAQIPLIHVIADKTDVKV